MHSARVYTVLLFACQAKQKHRCQQDVNTPAKASKFVLSRLYITCTYHMASCIIYRYYSYNAYLQQVT